MEPFRSLFSQYQNTLSGTNLSFGIQRNKHSPPVSSGVLLTDNYR
jgi:hypothetical protein